MDPEDETTEEIGEIDGARSGVPAVTGDRVVKTIEHPGLPAADESHDQNGLISKGFQEPSGQLTVEKRPARAAGMLLEGQVPSEQYRPQDGTDTGSPTATADRAPRSAATVER